MDRVGSCGSRLGDTQSVPEQRPKRAQRHPTRNAGARCSRFRLSMMKRLSGGIVATPNSISTSHPAPIIRVRNIVEADATQSDGMKCYAQLRGRRPSSNGSHNTCGCSRLPTDIWKQDEQTGYAEPAYVEPRAVARAQQMTSARAAAERGTAKGPSERPRFPPQIRWQMSFSLKKASNGALKSDTQAGYGNARPVQKPIDERAIILRLRDSPKELESRKTRDIRPVRSNRLYAV
ncbi:hypothetical protein REMIM1_PE00361 (plasmid) [Rhizobium etli bv. mimosae str. Mim1]|nr:hypothetical protein REMIM1_PE00361 [Rhizobium etli bv. mimosae str. Mim1]